MSENLKIRYKVLFVNLQCLFVKISGITTFLITMTLGIVLSKISKNL